MDKNNTNNLSEYFSDEEYNEFARELIFEEVYNAYEGEEITEFPDDDIFPIEIKAVDSCGKKIIMIPYQVNNHMVYGLILLAPVIHMGTVILEAPEPKLIEDYSEISDKVEKFKSSVKWNEEENN